MLKLTLVLLVATICVHGLDKPKLIVRSWHDKSEPAKTTIRQNLSGRISHGTQVTGDQQKFHAHQCRLVTDLPDYFMTRAVCGGSLVNEHWILTAAHCLEDGSTRMGDTVIFCGITDLGEAWKPSTVKRLATSREYRIHHDWKPKRNNYNDIAMIYLTEKIEQVPGKISCIPMPTSCEDYIGGTATVSGWGGMENTASQPKQLRTAVTVVRQHAMCKPFPSYRDDFSICAVGTMKENTCRGDSGGPMVQTTANNERVLIGLTSFGGDDCGNGVPTVYTKVCAFSDWIKEQMNGPVSQISTWNKITNSVKLFFTW